MVFLVVDPWSQTTAMLPSTPDCYKLVDHSTQENSGEYTKNLFTQPHSQIHGLPGSLLHATGDKEITYSNSAVTAKDRRFFSLSGCFESVIRTRRPNLIPVAKGNNIYGRKGKRRCSHCRLWRQKVGTSSP